MFPFSEISSKHFNTLHRNIVLPSVLEIRISRLIIEKAALRVSVPARAVESFPVIDELQWI